MLNSSQHNRPLERASNEQKEKDGEGGTPGLLALF